MEILRGYESGRWIPLIAPTPLLMIVAPRLTKRHCTPNTLVLIPGGHFDACTIRARTFASDQERDACRPNPLPGRSEP
jgi:uncharacterized protein